jgi:hypothetical protein
MRKEQVVELVGLAAVIAGLVFVGLEIRQNNRLAQAAAYQEIGSATAQNWADMSQDSEFNRVFLRHFYADSPWWADQDPQDVERLITAWIGFLRQYETIYLQVDLGLLDEVAMERLGWGLVRDIPALQYLWPHLGNVVEPTFAEYITEHWSEVPPLAGELFIAP